MLKKIIVFMLTTTLTVLCLFGATFEEFSVNYENIETIMGATHREVQRVLDVSGVNVLQTYHYLGADFASDDFAIITGDDYTETGYRPASTIVHANNSQALYDEYTIIGGVNADFFESYGVPQEAYIEDGKVISSGIGYANREVIGFKNDGSIVYGKPVFDGYEIVIKDPNGRERITMPVKYINASYTSNPYDIYAYFDTYSSTLPSGVNKYTLTVDESKGAPPKIFGHGIASELANQSSMTVADGTIVVVTQNPYIRNILQLGDQVSVQRKLTGDFENVEWAVGVYGKLVEDGQKISNIIGIDPTARHPRTSIGVKADGSVFFLAMDGRQSGYSQGATLYEMADLMISYGAVLAFNFDGGGSTTMVTRNQSNTFDVVNQPSDGQPRSVTNSVFIAIKTDFSNDTPYDIPNYSSRLDKPTNLRIENGLLLWDNVLNKKAYEVTINDVTYETTTAVIALKNYISSSGTYEIRIQAIGDGIYYSNSVISDQLAYDYAGPLELAPPNDFVISNDVLYWDQLDPYSSYRFVINDKSYDISINRFNLATLSLDPDIYTIEIIKLGDDYLTSNSPIAIYQYRIYSELELEIKDVLDLFKIILFLGNE